MNNEYIKTIANTSKSDFKPQSDEFLGEDGEIYCKYCKTARTLHLDSLWVRCLCECQSSELRRKEEEEKHVEKIKRLTQLQNNSFLGKRYKDVFFETTKITNKTFENAYNICYNYAERWQQKLETGAGIYLYGGTGVGKTHLTACIGNELLKNGVPVLFTSFVEISNNLLNGYATGQTDDVYINKLINIEFLVIDDIGTERIRTKNGDTFMQDKIYYIIDSRYKKQLPTIYSSNYSIGELIDDRGLEQRTADRIAETTIKINLKNAPNYRAEIYKENINDN